MNVPADSAQQQERDVRNRFIVFGDADRVAALTEALVQDEQASSRGPGVVLTRVTPRCARRMLQAARIARGAIVVVDAAGSGGRDPRRDLYLAGKVLGLRQGVVAVVGLDVYGADDRLHKVASTLVPFARSIGIVDVCVVHVSLPHSGIEVASEQMRPHHRPTLGAWRHAIAAAGQRKDEHARAEPDMSRIGTASAADHFEVTIAWFANEPMLPGRDYLLDHETGTAGVAIGVPKYRVDLATLDHLASRTLGMGEIGVCNLHLDHGIPFDPQHADPRQRSFILADRLTGETLAVGTLHFALRRSHNLRWQRVDVDKGAHAALKGHAPCVVWFTGLPASGKSTIANLVEERLHALGLHTYLLDGDNVRHGLNADLGFTQADRVENVRRVAEVARLMVDAGLVVLVAFISPFRAERSFARSLLMPNEFCEVFVDVPLAVAEARDPKGLYAKARRGLLPNFTGIDSPYERPEHPEVSLESHRLTPDEAAERVVEQLRRMGVMRSAPGLRSSGDDALLPDERSEG
ncbi:MAG TPA: adenylyl-sulfate kinase [Casimicrobiaceae bacterium]